MLLNNGNRIEMEQSLTINLTFVPVHCRNDKLLCEHYETVREFDCPLNFIQTLQKLEMMILKCYCLNKCLNCLN